ncbi:hypothetical protein CONPUDRAFT_71001 [Coniophora puteana RWD-64-598 SS2]|uniref:Uncharacterized protein n=1 Tax=Coniophora puteana (strain RWD-64-598) TaxID=741705 RepID=A0A5M3MYF0_CONPW|nr:uncharacterized protein CONPUDRAFT_71001 [Coniophora puteana RWD-64-598 SS2]EIW84160.1 hypothetical protein CONPUDRAFT_71001 [Coniophora puteana RWD-64-598 SS2]
MPNKQDVGKENQIEGQERVWKWAAPRQPVVEACKDSMGVWDAPAQPSTQCMQSAMQPELPVPLLMQPSTQPPTQYVQPPIQHIRPQAVLAAMLRVQSVPLACQPIQAPNLRAATHVPPPTPCCPPASPNSAVPPRAAADQAPRSSLSFAITNQVSKYESKLSLLNNCMACVHNEAHAAQETAKHALDEVKWVSKIAEWLDGENKYLQEWLTEYVVTMDKHIAAGVEVSDGTCVWGKKNALQNNVECGKEMMEGKNVGDIKKQLAVAWKIWTQGQCSGQEGKKKSPKAECEDRRNGQKINKLGACINVRPETQWMHKHHNWFFTKGMQSTDKSEDGGKNLGKSPEVTFESDGGILSQAVETDWLYANTKINQAQVNFDNVVPYDDEDVEQAYGTHVADGLSQAEFCVILAENTVLVSEIMQPVEQVAECQYADPGPGTSAYHMSLDVQKQEQALSGLGAEYGADGNLYYYFVDVSG